jgi:hypothetical protein
LFLGPLKKQIQTEEGKIMGKRRRLWMIGRIMLVLIGLGVIQTEAYGDGWNWKLLLSDKECNVYYDPDTAIRSPEGIVRVWWKEVFRTKEVLRSRGFTGSQYKGAEYQINVTEINCQKKECRRKFFMLCSGEGESLLCTIHSKQPDEWVPVREGHSTGALYWKLCR